MRFKEVLFNYVKTLRELSKDEAFGCAMLRIVIAPIRLSFDNVKIAV
jgi:hypothetical protein